MISGTRCRAFDAFAQVNAGALSPSINLRKSPKSLRCFTVS
jgi:hypothetical protein